MFNALDDLRCLRFSRVAGDGHLKNKVSRSVSGEEGAALLEFALSAAVLFMLLFGCISVCLALYTRNLVSDAAREGARWAIVRGASCTVLADCSATSAEIQTYVRSLGYPGVSPSNLNVTAQWFTASTTQPTTWTACSGSGCGTPGNAVQVQVQYAFPFSVPFLKSSTINMSSTSQMIIAN